MSITTTLFQNRETLKTGDYIKYTGYIFNDSEAKANDLVLTSTIPYGLALVPNSVCVSDNAYTLRSYPFEYDKNVLTIDLPTIPAEDSLLVTFVARKCAKEPCTETYETTITVDDVTSNEVVAKNFCSFVRNIHYI